MADYSRYIGTIPTASKAIGKNKSRSNIYKIRWQFRNNVSQSNFTVAKKFYFDVEWCYLVKYENGNQMVFTEHEITAKIKGNVFRRINIKGKTPEAVLAAGHFDETELFEI